MKKSLLLSVLALFLLGCSYLYVNYQAKQLIAAQIAVMNASYAELAKQGVMPAVQLNYKNIRANYWRDHYRLSGLTLEVAGVGTVAELDRLSLRGFQPGKLASQGQIEIRALRVSNLVQLMLPPELAKLLAESPLWLNYRYQYKAATGQLLLQQQLRVAQSFSLDLQIALGDAKALWQFGQKLAAMDITTQQDYSQSAPYQETLAKSMAQLTLQSGEVTIENTDFLQRLPPVLVSQTVTAPLVELQPQLEQFVQSTELVTERIRENALLFLANPQRLKLSFNLQRPLTWQQIQSGELKEELLSPEQWVAFIGLLVEAN